MKITLSGLTLLLISLFGNQIFAQENIEQEGIPNSDAKVFIGPDQQVLQPNSVKFAGERASLMNWSDVEEVDYLDFQKWKKERGLKDQNPLWKQNLQETHLTERMGFVLECVGECRSYRGVGFATVDYLSTVKEGDEVMTMKDSYMWVFLLDGTLVRLSPETSVTFKEINRGVGTNFIYSRINTGNVLWWSRTEHLFTAKDFKETDALFLPLSMYEANAQGTRLTIKEDDLFGYLKQKTRYTDKYKRLNKLIEESNEITNLSTYSFLTFPNGTIYGKDVIAEFIVLDGNESYVKRRDAKQIGLEGELEQREMQFFFRGYNNKSVTTLQVGQWYEVDDKGKSIQPAYNQKRFAMGEFITSNIPTLLTARELLVQKYSILMHEKADPYKLAQEYGYRLWDSIDKIEGDSAKRVEFLKEYTRRVETSNLAVAEQFREKLAARGEEATNPRYSAKYFRRAMGYFYNYREGISILSTNKELLNSERKKFWKRIHDIR